jgi:hypothetical protein
MTRHADDTPRRERFTRAASRYAGKADLDVSYARGVGGPHPPKTVHEVVISGTSRAHRELGSSARDADRSGARSGVAMMTILSLLIVWTAVGGLVGVTLGHVIARGSAEAR